MTADFKRREGRRLHFRARPIASRRHRAHVAEDKAHQVAVLLPRRRHQRVPLGLPRQNRMLAANRGHRVGHKQRSR